MTKRSFLRLFAYLAVLFLAVGGTWWAASHFVSQRQREAAASAPPPRDVLVDITRGDLSDTSTYVGRIEATSTLKVALPAPAEGAAVITATPFGPGSSIEDTAPIIYINGRPIIAFHGEFPLYRDIREGDEGPDVAMIQRSLIAAHYPVRESGRFDSLTAGAIIDIYERVHLSAPLSTPESKKPADKGEPSKDSSQPQEVVTLLQSEAIVFPPQATTLASLPAVGTASTGDALSIEVNGGGITVTASVDAAQGAQLHVGMCGLIQTTQSPVSTCITDIKSTSSSDGEAQGAGQDTTRVILTHSVEGTDESALQGLSEVPIDINITEPIRNTLLVPQPALIRRDSQSASLLVMDGDSLASVDVSSVICIGGMCAVSSSDPRLVEGARVKVDNE